MKFDKPFHIKIQPFYAINELISQRDLDESIDRANNLGGQNIKVDESDGNENTTILTSGGMMNWNLFHEPNGHKPEVNIHLMRLWTLQMVTQMVNEKAYVNEIHSEPKFEITEEDKELFLKTIEKMTLTLNDELEKANDSIITKKKNTFSFTEDE
jgi:hypothetical protein